MPPFKEGLLKRKLGSSASKTSTEKNAPQEETSEPESDEELIRGPLDAADDDSDSDHEPAADHSDQEKDEILFGDDVDSTLGDDDLSGSAADDSSELTDSEDDESEHSGEGDSDGEPSAESSADSGAESGAGPPPSGDEAEKNTGRTRVDKKQKKNKKLPPTHESGQPTSKTPVELLTDQIRETSVNIQPVGQKDEYESGDTSDEEDRVNTAGGVPAWWYREYPHVGYDVDGRRLLRPPQRDHIDNFLKQCEDPEFWRTVHDPSTGQDVRLSVEDLQLLHRLRRGLLPSADDDEYQPWIEWFSREVMATPLRAFPEHKRSFLPSRSDQHQISKIVHALKMGWAKTRKQIADERRRKKEKNFYNLWGSTSAEEEHRLRGIHKHIPAPRRPPPTHAESYNPPPEYLLDHKEMKEWNKLSETPWKRKYTFLPTQHSSLRAVPAYERYTRERFLRCLDLYLAPRAIKMRLTISPEELVPRLPAPRDLQPFPTAESLRLRGHEASVRSVDFDPSGQYIVSGSDDGTLKVWETSTGRCVRSVRLAEGPGGGEEEEESGVSAVAWCGARGLSLVCGAAGRRLVMVNPGAGLGDHRVGDTTDRLLRDAPPHAQVEERTAGVARWEPVSPEQWARGVRLAIAHFRPVSHVSWHARGDYVCVTLRDAGARAVVVHQVSRRASQLPLARAKGHVQCALFHPTRPLLFVATQRVVRVYDLVKQELVRKLQTGAQWISALAVHPAGDNLLVASYDRKCMWFDLELSARPYQTLRLHGAAVRAAAFHGRYPLFATAGDDPYLVVSHGMVYNDLLQNPLLVPLKQLAGGERRGELCVLALRWHPAQPWLLAGCADHTLRLYS